jgi:hypothetical protein
VITDERQNDRRGFRASPLLRKTAEEHWRVGARCSCSAWIGGNHPARDSEQIGAASFEHDSARPVGGYAAPQLHTHVVFLNLGETANGGASFLQPHELYRSQCISASCIGEKSAIYHDFMIRSRTVK